MIYSFFPRCAYGFRAHMMNLGSYCLGLIPMTFLVVKIKPGMAFNSTGIINETTNHLETVDTLVFQNFNILKLRIVKMCFSLEITSL